MPITTPNLGLKKPLGNEVFNRQAYNENLDLMDQNAAKKMVLDTHLADYTQELKTDSKQSVTLPHGLSILNAPRATQLKPKFKGRQLVNLLGRDGNCEDLVRWSPWQSTLALDTANKVYGTSSIKITGTAVGTSTCGKANITFKANKYYLVVADVKNGTVGDKIRIGRSTNFNGVPVSSLSTTLFKPIYHKFVIGSSDVVDGIEVQGFNTSIGQYFYVDGIRLYEITQAEYNEIDILTPEQIAARYPYVDSFQCVKNPAVRVEGENLLPPFSQWTAISTEKYIDSPYRVNLRGVIVWEHVRIYIDVLPNTAYTISGFCIGSATLQVANMDGNWLAGVFSGFPKATFNTGNNTRVYVNVTNGTTLGVGAVDNPMLVLGDKLPDQFKPYNPSHLYLQTPLYDGESLEEIDGNWVRTKKWEKKVLDGSLGWVFSADKTGYKQFKAPIVGGQKKSLLSSPTYVIKHDGKIVNLDGNGSRPTDTHYLFDNDGSADANYLYLTISDTDSGWGENYTPTSDEVKAYFNGWRMYDYDTANVNNPYTGTSTKGWVRINSATGNYTGNGQSTLPTMAHEWWTPYQLHYQLATPTTEVVPHEGELALHEGANQVEVFEGVVVRELATPRQFSLDNTWFINNTNPSSGDLRPSKLNNKTKSILAVFKNSLADPLWLHRLPTNNTYGMEDVYILPSNFDPTAQYSVTYLALPEEFTAPLLSVDATATYDRNIKTTVDTLVDELAKVTTDVTALEMALRNRGLLRKTPICKVESNSVNQSIISDTPTNLTFNLINVDTNKFFNLSEPAKIKINTPGKYLVTVTANFNYNNTGVRQLAARVNGILSHEVIQLPPTTENGKSTVICHTFLLDFKDGDYFNIVAFQSSGVSLTVSGVNLAIVKVGD